MRRSTGHQYRRNELAAKSRIPFSILYSVFCILLCDTWRPEHMTSSFARSRLLSGVFALAPLLLLGGCGSPQKGTPPTPGSPAADAAKPPGAAGPAGAESRPADESKP